MVFLESPQLADFKNIFFGIFWEKKIFGHFLGPFLVTFPTWLRKSCAPREKLHLKFPKSFQNRWKSCAKSCGSATFAIFSGKVAEVAGSCGKVAERNSPPPGYWKLDSFSGSDIEKSNKQIDLMVKNLWSTSMKTSFPINIRLEVAFQNLPRIPDIPEYSGYSGFRYSGIIRIFRHRNIFPSLIREPSRLALRRLGQPFLHKKR